jgi:hypothetical protein
MSYNSHEIEQLKSTDLYYKNSTTPFATVLEHGKPAQVQMTDDMFKFIVGTDNESIPVIHDNSEDESENSDDSLDKPIQYAPPPKRSNIKIIESNDNIPFDFDAI